jgi:RNA-binding protein
MPLTSKARATLRAEGHRLSPTVHVGHHGLTPSLVRALDDALRTRELVKVALNRTADAKPKAMASELAEAVGADVVQVIGRTATLYRQNPELTGTPGAAPPWRRGG